MPSDEEFRTAPRRQREVTVRRHPGSVSTGEASEEAKPDTLVLDLGPSKCEEITLSYLGHLLVVLCCGCLSELKNCANMKSFDFSYLLFKIVLLVSPTLAVTKTYVCYVRTWQPIK
jgi:hypothetical protein